MNRRELLRELSRVQATWINQHVPASGDADITPEEESDYLGRISAVFERARQDMARSRRQRSVAAANAAIAAILAAHGSEIDDELAFNPNQPRDRRGRWTKGGDGAPAVPQAPTAAPSRSADAETRLRAAIESGEASRRPLSGGAMASVDLVTYNDGTKAVRKWANRVPSGRSPKDQQDAEELGAMIARAIGVKTPAIVRVSDAQIVMEYEDEASPGTSLPSWRADALYKTPDGVKMGLLDVLISNPDRHHGNYLVDDDEKQITAIDHGFAWEDLEDYYPSPFVSGNFGRTNPLSPADVEELRPKLAALRPEFERMGHLDWYNQMDELFTWVAQRATGTERVLG